MKGVVKALLMAFIAIAVGVGIVYAAQGLQGGMYTDGGGGIVIGDNASEQDVEDNRIIFQDASSRIEFEEYGSIWLHEGGGLYFGNPLAAGGFLTAGDDIFESADYTVAFYSAGLFLALANNGLLTVGDFMLGATPLSGVNLFGTDDEGEIRTWLSLDGRDGQARAGMGVFVPIAGEGEGEGEPPEFLASVLIDADDTDTFADVTIEANTAVLTANSSILMTANELEMASDSSSAKMTISEDGDIIFRLGN